MHTQMVSFICSDKHKQTNNQKKHWMKILSKVNSSQLNCGIIGDFIFFFLSFLLLNLI